MRTTKPLTRRSGSVLLIGALALSACGTTENTPVADDSVPETSTSVAVVEPATENVPIASAAIRDTPASLINDDDEIRIGFTDLRAAAILQGTEDIEAAPSEEVALERINALSGLDTTDSVAIQIPNFLVTSIQDNGFTAETGLSVRDIDQLTWTTDSDLEFVLLRGADLFADAQSNETVTVLEDEPERWRLGLPIAVAERDEAVALGSDQTAVTEWSSTQADTLARDDLLVELATQLDDAGVVAGVMTKTIPPLAFGFGFGGSAQAPRTVLVYSFPSSELASDALGPVTELLTSLERTDPWDVLDEAVGLEMPVGSGPTFHESVSVDNIEVIGNSVVADVRFPDLPPSILFRFWVLRDGPFAYFG